MLEQDKCEREGLFTVPAKAKVSKTQIFRPLTEESFHGSALLRVQEPTKFSTGLKRAWGGPAWWSPDLSMCVPVWTLQSRFWALRGIHTRSLSTGPTAFVMCGSVGLLLTTCLSFSLVKLECLATACLPLRPQKMYQSSWGVKELAESSLKHRIPLW